MILLLLVIVILIIIIYLLKQKENYQNSCRNSSKINDIEYRELEKSGNCIIGELSKNENEDKINLYNIVQKCSNGTDIGYGFIPSEIIEFDKNALVDKVIINSKDNNQNIKVVDNDKILNIIIKYLVNMSSNCLISSPNVQNSMIKRMNNLDRKYKEINVWYQKNKPSSVVKSGSRAGQNLNNKNALQKKADIGGIQQDMPKANMNNTDPDKVDMNNTNPDKVDMNNTNPDKVNMNNTDPD